MKRSDLIDLIQHPRVHALIRQPWLIIALGVLILLMLLLMVIASMNAERAAYDRLLNAHSDAAALSALSQEFNAWKTRIDEQQASTKSFTTPLLDDVTESAAQHGLVLSDISTSGEQRLSARVENTTFEQSISWLYNLHTEHSALIGNTTFQRSREPGKINIQTTLYRE